MESDSQPGLLFQPTPDGIYTTLWWRDSGELPFQLVTTHGGWADYPGKSGADLRFKKFGI